MVLLKFLVAATRRLRFFGRELKMIVMKKELAVKKKCIKLF